jgi:cytochrome o ubiquinol oxidase subunit 2
MPAQRHPQLITLACFRIRCIAGQTKAFLLVRNALGFLAAAALGGCQAANLPVIDPQGPGALAQRNLLFLVTGLVLIVVVPVFLLTFWFVWRYRASNPAGRYTPEWSSSPPLEVAIWLVPALIVSTIGYLVWTDTHSLDPYRRAAAPAAPLDIEVVAQDWKWLFIYPEQNIASVNEFVFPSDRPVRIKLTSDTVMNALYIPGLAGQIYAMAGMQTELNFKASGPTELVGRNTQFSGDGFPDQQFKVRAASPSQFDAWIANARRSSATLDDGAYAKLAKPSSNVPITFYASVTPGLFERIIEKYAGPAMHHEHEADIGMPAMTGAR